MARSVFYTYSDYLKLKWMYYLVGRNPAFHIWKVELDQHYLGAYLNESFENAYNMIPADDIRVIRYLYQEIRLRYNGAYRRIK